jgi:hypothetical protein
MSLIKTREFPSALDQFERAITAARLGGEAKSLQTEVERLREAECRVVFSGHFSAGKSSLINALLGQNLLPTSDLRESGAPVWIRSGSRDMASVLLHNGKSIAIKPEADDIAEYSSRLDKNGRTRRLEDLAKRIDVVLRDAPIPAGSVWIDSPGMNDDNSIGAVALNAAISADLLVWVLMSRATLALVETTTIRQLVNARGPSGILFALNCFLEEDTPEMWVRYQNRQVKVHLERIASFASEMGFVGGWKAPVAAVSARAMRNQLTADWHGGSALVRLLSDLSNTNGATVKHGRLIRLATASMRASESLTPTLDAEQAKVDAQAGKHTTYLARVEVRKSFRAGALKIIERAAATASEEITNAGGAIASSINSENVRAGTLYEQELNAKINGILSRYAHSLVVDINRIAIRHGVKQLELSHTSALANALAPSSISILVPSVEVEGGGIAGGAAAGAAAGAIFLGPIGALAGAVIGAFAGGGMESQKRKEEAAAVARGALRGEGARAADQVRSYINLTHNKVLEICLEPEPQGMSMPDRSKLNKLIAAKDTLDRLAKEARSAAEQLSPTNF